MMAARMAGPEHSDTWIGGAGALERLAPDTIEDVREDLSDALSRVRQLEVLLALETRRADEAERLLGVLTRSHAEAIAVLRKARVRR